MTTEGRTELVVVGVDGSPASAMAMAWAARYAKALGATVRAVLAWHYPVTAGAGAVSVPPTVVTDDVERTRRQDLDKAIAATFGDPPSVTVEPVVVYGHPAQVLIEQARDADLLVVDGDPLTDIELLAASGRHLRLIMRAGDLLRNEL